MNGLEIGAALTGLAALVTAIFGGVAMLRENSRNADRAASHEADLAALIRRLLKEEEDPRP